MKFCLISVLGWIVISLSTQALAGPSCKGKYHIEDGSYFGITLEISDRAKILRTELNNCCPPEADPQCGCPPLERTEVLDTFQCLEPRPGFSQVNVRLPFKVWAYVEGTAPTANSRQHVERFFDCLFSPEIALCKPNDERIRYERVDNIWFSVNYTPSSTH